MALVEAEGANDLAIFVDQDETLLHVTNDKMIGAISRRPNNLVNLVETGDAIPIPEEIVNKYSLKDHYTHIVVRPYAHEFLSQMQALTPNLFVLTSGGKDFQIEMLKLAGLLDYFVEVFDRNTTEVPEFKVKILVDDLPDYSIGIASKMKLLGENSVQIQVPDFHYDLHDDKLLAAAQQVKEIAEAMLGSGPITALDSDQG